MLDQAREPGRPARPRQCRLARGQQRSTPCSSSPTTRSTSSPAASPSIILAARPAAFLAEMVRVCAPGGTVVLAATASPPTIPPRRPRSTRWSAVATRRRRHSRPWTRWAVALCRGRTWRSRAGCFEVAYHAADLVAQSFPVADDRAGLLALIEDSVAGDRLGMRACREADGVRIGRIRAWSSGRGRWDRGRLEIGRRGG